MELPEHYETDLLFFFDGHPDALGLYGALLGKMDARFSGCRLKVQKTQISFYSPRLFAMVSLPRRKSERGIVLTLGLGRQINSPRAAAVSEPCPGRWTYHFLLTDKSELDSQLLGFLDEALSFSREKRKPPL